MKNMSCKVFCAHRLFLGSQEKCLWSIKLSICLNKTTEQFYRYIPLTKAAKTFYVRLSILFFNKLSFEALKFMRKNLRASDICVKGLTYILPKLHSSLHSITRFLKTLVINLIKEK